MVTWMEQAARQIRKGKEIVESQRRIVEKAKAMGLDRANAEEALKIFEEGLTILKTNFEDLRRRVGLH